MSDPVGTADPTDRIRVLIVDDQRLVLTALRAYLDESADMCVVGEAMDGHRAISQAVALRPDVILMDLQMPGLDGIRATEAIVQAHPTVAILAVTTFDSEDFAIPALRAGARGYLLKSEEPEVILEAIRSAHRGESVVSREITHLLIEKLAESAHRAADSEIVARAQGLTAREWDVLRALCQGRSNREISRTLILSETTVKTHMSAIMSKLGARDRVQIVVLAYANGLVSSAPVR